VLNVTTRRNYGRFTGPPAARPLFLHDEPTLPVGSADALGERLEVEVALTKGYLLLAPKIAQMHAPYPLMSPFEELDRIDTGARHVSHVQDHPKDLGIESVQNLLHFFGLTLELLPVIVIRKREPVAGAVFSRPFQSVDFSEQSVAVQSAVLRCSTTA
jgi:hypothetical protein